MNGRRIRIWDCLGKTDNSLTLTMGHAISNVHRLKEWAIYPLVWNKGWRKGQGFGILLTKFQGGGILSASGR
jgi:hypothetical protein